MNIETAEIEECLYFFFINSYFKLSNAYSSDKECHSRIKSFYNEYYTNSFLHHVFEIIDKASCIFDRNSIRVSHAIYFSRLFNILLL